MDALVECKCSVRAVDDAYMESGIKAESWQTFRSTDTIQDATCFKARCRHASECALNFQKVVSVYQYHRPRNTQMCKWKTLEWAHPWRHSFLADWSVHHAVSMAMTLCFLESLVYFHHLKKKKNFVVVFSEYRVIFVNCKHHRLNGAKKEVKFASIKTE